jgi:hypothetical protein
MCKLFVFVFFFLIQGNCMPTNTKGKADAGGFMQEIQA